VKKKTRKPAARRTRTGAGMFKDLEAKRDPKGGVAPTAGGDTLDGESSSSGVTGPSHWKIDCWRPSRT
jgi:hypothetical protein